MKKLIPVDERGNALGEFHHNARLSDDDVELIRKIYEEGMVGYRTLAKTFDVSRYTIKSICTFERRAATPDRWVERKEKNKPS